MTTKLGTLWLLLFNMPGLLLLRFEAPVPEKIWSERCSKNSIVLNDCNWCKCSASGTFTCEPRACSTVDMFGHFNDAIKETDPGMQGRGVWRSNVEDCEPGKAYQKDDDLCYCNDNGKWPNVQCREIFRVLHPVETTEPREPVENASCIPTKLYLFDCNVCSCPYTGKIDLEKCTKRKCEDENTGRMLENSKDTAEAIYATCIPNNTYKLGCHTCMCLRNNRLLCDKCSQDEEKKFITHKTECHLKKPGAIFKKDCNFCYCDRNQTIYCTVKNCLEHHTEISLPKALYSHVEKIEDEQNCVPYSKFKKDCNTCHCFMELGVKYLGCSMKTCKFTTDETFERTSCVEGTSYQLNCMICHCVVDEGKKREFCTVDETCLKENNTIPSKLSSLHGYCEPLHVYQQDCNRCTCLADGKTAACTSMICPKTKGKKKNGLLKSTRAEFDAYIQSELHTEDKSLIMEFVPFVHRGYVCPKEQTYKVGCNICYCMDSGNAVCTTKKC